MGKGEGGVSGPIRVSWRGKRGASRLAQVFLLTHTHTYTHLLSRRFRNCRLRPDHPQEGKQALISTLQGPALSPGLSPLHITHYTLHTQHTSSLTISPLSPEVLKFIQKTC